MRVFISTLACLILDSTTGAALKPRRLDEGQPVLTASGFVRYPGYSGNLAVAGTVSIATAGTTQTIDLSFTGLDAACAAGAGPAGNSCGVHIHSGKTCSDASLVGGHYFAGAVTAAEAEKAATRAARDAASRARALADAAAREADERTRDFRRELAGYSR